MHCSYRSRVDCCDDNGTRHDVCEVTFRIDPFESRIANDFGSVDLTNSYTVGDRTWYMETRQYYLRELKEQGIMSVKWKADTENCSDLYTKIRQEKSSKIMQGHM